MMNGGSRRWGAWVAAALVVGCGGKTVVSGGNPVNGSSGAGGALKDASAGRDNGSAQGGANAAGSNGSSAQPSGGEQSADDPEAFAGAPAVGGSPAAAGAPAVGGSPAAGGAQPTCSGSLPPAPATAGATQGPCDIYAQDGGPCVAAHSTVRALYATYAGPLYQVRLTDGTTHDIGATEPGGFADSAAQDSLCASNSCTISIVYDQSGHGNHLTHSPPGFAKMTPGNEAKASAAPITLGGHRVYGVRIAPGVAYRNNQACGTATGDDAETEYMIADGNVHNGGCCFDYGNTERSNQDDGEGSAEAVYFGSTIIWGKGDGSGPWVMADLENGLWAGDLTPYAASKSLDFKYVTAMVKGDSAGRNHWAIKSGDAQSGPLRAVFDGIRPSSRYNPMRKQGGIVLGSSGDNSNAGIGNFFEGVMTAHFSSSVADDAVQANVNSVYGAP